MSGVFAPRALRHVAADLDASHKVPHIFWEGLPYFESDTSGVFLGRRDPSACLRCLRDFQLRSFRGRSIEDRKPLSCPVQCQTLSPRVHGVG